MNFVSFIRNIMQDHKSASSSVSIPELQLNNAVKNNFGSTIDSYGRQISMGGNSGFLNTINDYAEMDEYPLISSALDIYADESTQKNPDKNSVVWISSEDSKEIEKELTSMLDRIDIDTNIWSINRTMCQYGNNFEEILIDKDTGVVGLSPIPVKICRRVTNKTGDLIGYVASLSDKLDLRRDGVFKFQNGIMKSEDGLSAAYEPWKVVHFRLLSKDRASSYGTSVLEAARRPYQRLVLLEDAVMVFKLTRSPSRNVFRIDVSGLSRREAEAQLRRVKDQYRKRKFVDSSTGKLSTKVSPLAMDEDFFVGTVNGVDTVGVDVLNGPNYQQMEDVQYFQNLLFGALRIPRAYLGYDENMPSRATLSQEDVRFYKTALRTQIESMRGIKKICDIHLASKNIDPKSVKYKVQGHVSNHVVMLANQELARGRGELAAMYADFVDKEYVLKDILKLDQETISRIIKQKEKEVRQQPVESASIANDSREVNHLIERIKMGI